ncbi:hypothetical protein INH39_27990 [Massilia violaceinigra]|uniref:GntR C-terminal domain-containing protein n=1 Tax=Massilia violaceinigra TaxID=2045208 RepID=A0ABY4A6Q5_9BURK|nr:hypothetical protein [Massilia violaceinigra]UOD29216.1 hypothetical protein INH39_27990 [Massilia violaceinigra]
MITPDPLEALKEAFQSDDGFLVELRCFARWNKAAFARLVAAMQHYLQSAEPGEHVERWIAEGFWMHDAMVRELSRSTTRSAAEQVYYDAAYQRLGELAGWFFTGQSPWQDGAPSFAA